MMEDNMVHTQCMEIAKCIGGLSQNVTEGGNGNGISEILNDLLKAMRSFQVLGRHYVSELVKKCKELESKNGEINDLFSKLEHVGSSLTCVKQELDESRQEAGTLREDVGRLTASIDSLSYLLKKDQERLDELRQNESNLKWGLHLIASKQTLSRSDYDQELLQMKGRGFDEATLSCFQTILERSIRPSKCSAETQTWSVQASVATQTECDPPTSIQVADLLQAPLQSCNKRRIEVIDLDSDCEDNNVKGCSRGALWRSSGHFGTPGQGCNKSQFGLIDLDRDCIGSRKPVNFTSQRKARRLDNKQVLDSHFGSK